jgi:nitroreductase
MEFDEVLKRRRMTRRFSSTALDAAVLNDVLDAGTRAPSAGFSQGVDLLVMTESETRARFWELASDAPWREHQPGAAGLISAPVIILPVADPDAYALRYSESDKSSTLLGGVAKEDWHTPYWLVDASYATMLMLLAATANGLGSLFFQLHNDESALCEGLGIPAGRKLIGAIALGDPLEEQPQASPTRRKRRDFDDVVHKESW